jgi:hypothetical protein
MGTGQPKRWRGMALFVVMLSFCIGLTETSASGAMVYEATAKNETELVVRVEAYNDQWSSGMGLGEQTIQPGGSYTWRSSTYCLCGFKGQIRDSAGNWYKMQDTDCNGNKTSSIGFSACCWNLNFKVCRKEGVGNKEIKDGDYGFCKQ